MALNMFVTLAQWSFMAFGLLLLLAQLICHEAGYRIGLRHRQRKAIEAESTGIVVGGILGLLAFILALTLSFASNRFNESRGDTLAEANAIGTAWLRAEAVANPRGQEIARLLEQYAQVRLDFIHASNDVGQLQKLNQETNALQSTIWGHVAAIIRDEPNPVSASLMAAVNDVFDTSTAERFAYERTLPPQLFWLLMGMATLGMAALGYQLGLTGRPARFMVVLLTAMWTVVIVDILDLASARFGQIRTDDAAYLWTIQGFKGGLKIPPAPGAQ
jgi:hypothetical protein